MQIMARQMLMPIMLQIQKIFYLDDPSTWGNIDMPNSTLTTKTESIQEEWDLCSGFHQLNKAI
jgi:hypothetical protein